MKYRIGDVEKMSDEEILLHMDESPLFPYEYGRRLQYVYHDIVKAFEYYKKAAESDFYFATWAIARMLEEEELHLTDEEKAYWYKRAADKNDLFSMWKLAHCYRDGRGVKQNIEEYIRLITYLTEQGYCSVALELADLYERGEYVEQSYEKAFKIYGDFAFGENSSLEARYKYAYYLLHGIGCTKNRESAKEHFLYLARYHHSLAIEILRNEFHIEIS
ncbi:MAG: sel1 repeat family protein [Bacilli bacterium]|nr:sel1 repeat family protein [Bacilli bacterium]